MYLSPFHLGYCTNIHAGETWQETFDAIQLHVPAIKNKVSPNASFGIGLRLSYQAALYLTNNTLTHNAENGLTQNAMQDFQSWLTDHDCYVFTINGFPYGAFHHQSIKSAVHEPDWTHLARRDYTILLADILAILLPEGLEGSISTSPLGYKPLWEQHGNIETSLQKSLENIGQVVKHLNHIKEKTGKLIHLGFEPEPDGYIDHTQDSIDFFKAKLYPYLDTLSLIIKDSSDSSSSENPLYSYVGICFDICHFAVMYENPVETLLAFKKGNIKISKVQISAALHAEETSLVNMKVIKQALAPFAESTYLHQTLAQKSNGTQLRFLDLPDFIKDASEIVSMRSHFHVPITVESYGVLGSTQKEIVDTLNYLKKDPICTHLEVETYTWEVLPDALKKTMDDSVAGELKFVQNALLEQRSNNLA